MKSKAILSITAAVVASLGSSTFSQAATLTWDADTVTTGAQDGPGTYTVSSTNWWNGTTNVAHSSQANPNPDDIIFGASSGAAGTVTLTDTFFANSLTFNAAGTGNYTLSTGAVLITGTAGMTVNSSATISGVMRTNAGAYVVASGQTLSLGGGVGGDVNFLTGGQTGGGTLSLTAGNYLMGGNPIIGNGSTTSGGLVVGGTSVLNTGTGQLVVGTSLTNVTGSTTVGNAPALLTVSGGTLNSSSTGNGANPAFTSSSGIIQIGRGQNGVVNVTGGAINMTSTTREGIRMNRGTTSTSVLNISGGTVTTAGTGGGYLAMNYQNGAGAAGTSTLNLSGTGVLNAGVLELNSAGTTAGSTTFGSSTVNITGGAAYLGGLVNTGAGTSTYAINLSGGTVGAAATFSTPLNLTLSNTNGGVIFRSADASGNAFNIGLTGAISGTGGFTKTGLGMLTLSGVNSYAGDTTIAAGNLTLTGTAELSDTGRLSLLAGTSLSLSAAAGTETVGTLTLNGNGIAPGTYTAAQLSGFAPGIAFTSAGETLTVVNAVPEPSSLLAATAGVVALLGLRAVRKQA